MFSNSSANLMEHVSRPGNCRAMQSEVIQAAEQSCCCAASVTISTLTEDIGDNALHDWYILVRQASLVQLLECVKANGMKSGQRRVEARCQLHVTSVGSLGRFFGFRLASEGGAACTTMPRQRGLVSKGGIAMLADGGCCCVSSHEVLFDGAEKCDPSMKLYLVAFDFLTGKVGKKPGRGHVSTHMLSIAVARRGRREG